MIPHVNFESENSDATQKINGPIRSGCMFANFASSGCPRISDFSSASASVNELLGYIQSKPNQTCGELLGKLLECPSRTVLEKVERTGPDIYWKDGHLSKKFGFLPPDMSHLGKLQTLPGPSSWAMLGRRMPGLLSRNRFREAARQLPVCSADSVVLPDSSLHEAIVVISTLAHAFRYEQRMSDDFDANEDIPEGIMQPWIEITARLGRKDLFMGWLEGTIMNCKWKDTTRQFGDLWSLENTEMFYPVFRTKTEHVFLQVMTDMLEKFTPAVEAMVIAQEAVILRDNDSLTRALLIIKSAIDVQIQVFHKIAVNATVSSMYCDPVQWSKTTARHGAAWKEGVPGLSGLGSPMFHAIDCFLGRKNYESQLGAEALFIRSFMPAAHIKFFEALNEISVGDYCSQQADNPELKGLFNGILESYAGERGLLGTHRYKVYGFLELAFKSGRTETNGHTMTADDRGWEVVHDQFQKARMERMQIKYQRCEDSWCVPTVRGTFLECPWSAKIKERNIIDKDDTGTTRKVTIDLEGTGITYLPGDRLTVLPENSPLDVQNTLNCLGLSESTTVQLVGDWSIFFEGKEAVSTIELVKVARLRPLPMSSLEVLSELCSHQYLTSKPELQSAINEMKQIAIEIETEYTFSDLIEVNIDTNILEYSPHVLCKLFHIIRPRTYSISSTPESGLQIPDSLELTVTRKELELSTGNKSIGVGSGFLNPPVDANIFGNGTPLRIGISRPLLFKVPTHPGTPIVLFAGGSGIAPLRSFIQHRVKNSLSGENHLFLGVRSSNTLLYEKELAELVSCGKLHLDVAFSREDVKIDGVDEDLNFQLIPGKRCYLDEVMKEKQNSEKIWQLMLPTNVGGLGGHFYVCGSVDICKTIFNGLRNITKSHGLDGLDVLKDMFAHYRILTEVYKTPSQSNNQNLIHYSELSKQNTPEKGFWLAINKKVYDLTKFVHFHPGGAAIILANSGFDATHPFEQCSHDTNAEIISLMETYEIGLVAPVSFRSLDAEQIYDHHLKFLKNIVEMENTFHFDATSQSKTEYHDARDLMDTRYLRNMLNIHQRVLLTMAPAICGGELQLLVQEYSVLMEDETDFCLPTATHAKLMNTRNGKCALHTLHIFKYLSATKHQENPIHKRAEMDRYIHALLEESEKFLFNVKTAVANALARVEVSSSNDSLQLEIPEVLKHLGSIMGILKTYLCNLKDILANRYVLRENRTGKMLWEQLKVRSEENCLFLLMNEKKVQIAAQDKLASLNSVQNLAVNISLSLAASSEKKRDSMSINNQRSLGLSRAFNRASFRNGKAESKQLARISQVINRLGEKSNEKPFLAIEYIRGLFMSMSTQNEGQEQIDSIDNDLDELYLLGGSSILIVYIEEKCGYCLAATNLLQTEDVDFRTIDVTHDQILRTLIIKQSKSRQFPQIFIGSRYVGSLSELRSIHKAGWLHELNDIRNQSCDLNNLTKLDIEQALQRKDLPNYAIKALNYFLKLYERSPDIVTTSFDELAFFYFEKETKRLSGIKEDEEESETTLKPMRRLGSRRKRRAEKVKSRWSEEMLE